MSYILLHKDNLHTNLKLLGKKAGGKEKIFAVLKDNAYGHGLEIFAKEVANFGLKRAVVRDTNEATKIKNLFDEILILSEKDKNIKPVKNHIFAINSIDSLKNVPKKTIVALKVDTGMHRNGIHIKELDSACKLISENNLNLHSIFTHFRTADELGSEFFWQKENFLHVKMKYNELKHKYKLKDTFFHSCNSSALIRSKNFDDDFARVGIAMYGYDTLPNSFDKLPLKPVLELFAEKISQRDVNKGEKIGYGVIYKAVKKIY
jgi:alanine racemase